MTNLYCNNCPNLEIIEPSANLNILECRSCPLLKEIPNCNFRMIDCSNCKLITEIPRSVNLTDLICEDVVLKQFIIIKDY